MRILTWVILDDVAQGLKRHLDTVKARQVGWGHLALLEGHERVQILRLRTQVVQQVDGEALRVLQGSRLSSKPHPNYNITSTKPA